LQQRFRRALATTMAVMPAASAAPVTAASASTTHTLHVRQIAFGMKLFHRFRPNGKGDVHREPLTSPDDMLAGRDVRQWEVVGKCDGLFTGALTRVPLTGPAVHPRA
jgi:hypothetical protein